MWLASLRRTTDEAKHYQRVGRLLADQQAVHNRSKEYVGAGAFPDTLEGYFSTFKRGMCGVYQYCFEKNTYIAIWRSSISATMSWSLASFMSVSGRSRRCGALSARGCLTGTRYHDGHAGPSRDSHLGA